MRGEPLASPPPIAANRLPGRLGQWRLVREGPEIAATAAAWPLLWSDAKGFEVRRIGSDSLHLQFLNRLAVELDIGRRLIIDRSCPPAADDALDHLLSNQVAPRIIAHEGELVLHASGALAGTRALLMLGESGSGKSTLAASFANDGHRLIADDGILVRAQGGAVIAEAVQPSLRLREDSYSALFEEAAPAPGAGGKLRLPIDGDAQSGEPSQVAAIFLIEPGPPAAPARCSRLAAADACMALVANSFELDPTDLGRAAAKLARAAAVAAAVPVFALSCPRDFARLAEVRSAMLAA